MNIEGQKFYLLPGALRTEDAVLPASSLRVEWKSLEGEQPAAGRKFRTGFTKVSRYEDEECTGDGIPAIPCTFRADLNSLDELAAEMDSILSVGDDLGPEDPIGRLQTGSLIALADGSVHSIKMPNACLFGNVVITNKLPVRISGVEGEAFREPERQRT